MGAIIPKGYTRVREAIFAIAEIRYAGTEPAEAVKNVNAAGYKARFSREQLEECAADFWEAVDNEKIAVTIEQMTTGGLLQVAPDLLQGIPGLRRYSVSGLTLLRSQHLLYFHLEQRFPHDPQQPWADWLKRFQLLVENSELQRLGRKLRDIRKRKKSRPASANPPGRPGKLDKVKPIIRDIVEGGKWAYPDTLGKLTNLVNKNRAGSDIGVSDTTVARALAELFQDTSDNRYFRPTRRTARVQKVSV